MKHDIEKVIESTKARVVAYQESGGTALTEALVQEANTLFVCEDGEPRSFIIVSGRTTPYILYCFGHRGIEDRRADLAHLMSAALAQLKAAGAIKLIWRLKPEFTYDYTSPFSIGTYLRARFVALDKDNISVKIETSRDILLEDVTKEVVTPQSAPVIENGSLAFNPPAGYDLVEPTDAAVLACAKIVHAAVEALNKTHNELTLTWEQSKDSCIAGVRRTLANPGETPEQNHQAWMDYRRDEGWVYGAVKDPVAKTHPCMVPYNQLDPYQRSKDALFQAIVRTFFGV